MSSITHLQRVRRIYKTILRLHRGLPLEIQSLGNNYLRDEFKRHKKCNSTEANVFLNEWANYAISLAKQLGLQGPKTAEPLGKNLNNEDIEKLRDEQVYQLYELLMAATGTSDEKIKPS
ncbi:succinate dehydrogenase assembly factor 3, mitochondrial [Leptopilina boulardi]|uniref:succinate dehydrogenase assembly factor 3, mitochondrial n=1 Tax=Leptopilina boulardi TaxID=63433 RepID=UPI0021F58584|nr:succinate dehydrogenase assembly factor 3, mitochondrial [Leptopilina boulardi]